MVERQAEKTGVVLIQDLPADLPRVLGDERRIKQVLLNLLSNAVKFTREGGSVTVAAGRKGEELFIAVADTGVGIAPGNMARAFESFGQIDSTVARYHQGAGLGLPLSRQLMELHGGKLELFSTVNVGTIATMVLPPSRVLARPKSVAA
jgi:signal transduction histidine kinase